MTPNPARVTVRIIAVNEDGELLGDLDGRYAVCIVKGGRATPPVALQSLLHHSDWREIDPSLVQSRIVNIDLSGIDQYSPVWETINRLTAVVVAP